MPQQPPPWNCGPLQECPQAQDLRQIKSDLSKLVAFIEGDDSDGKPGLRVRLDRLEQTAKTRMIWMTVMGAPVAVLLLERAIHYLGVKP